MTLAGFDHLLAAGQRLQWDAETLDLTADAAAWRAVPAAAAGRVRRLVAGFCVAEVAVAEHLEPFAPATADPRAQACFRLQQGDERRHARFFARVAREVVGLDPAGADPVRGVRAVAPPEVVRLFDTDLPALAARLAAGAARLEEGVGLYHLVLEGIVFSIGQTALLDELDALGTLPTVRDGLARVQGDERWHVGLGVMCLQAAGASADVEALAARAATAWGPHVATSGRVAHALATHRRRTAMLERVGA
jgi:ribonucleoside-diphosphate reductase beta chain